MKVALYTLGCKVNQYDSQAMAGYLEKAGHTIVPFDEQADVYVINSCTVTAESDRKTRQAIGKAKRKNPNALVCVAGCYAQHAGTELLQRGDVDAVLGTQDRHRIVEVLETAVKGTPLNAVEIYRDNARYEEGQGALIERARAYLKIQDGCDRHCTYCIIPQARGPIRYRSLEALQAEAQKAAEAGHAEVVLTGIRLASYGRERGLTLADALRAVAQTDVRRIRLGSLDPDEISQAFIDACAAEPKFCRQFHLSLQSGCDATLHRMARRYTTAEFADTVERLRAAMPDVSLTTDIMCGFVGETEEDHQASLAFCERIGFAKLHVFPYSKREGTAAARMTGHLPNAVKQRRAAEMIALGQRLEQRYLTSLIGTQQEVVLETPHQNGYLGHTRGYAPVLVTGPGLAMQDVVCVTIEKVEKNLAKGLVKTGHECYNEGEERE